MNTKTKPLLIHFTILIILCLGFGIGARTMGQRGLYLAGAYMLTRLLFYNPHFPDAPLRFGRLRDYIKFWLYALGITVMSFVVFTLSRSTVTMYIQVQKPLKSFVIGLSSCVLGFFEQELQYHA